MGSCRSCVSKIFGEMWHFQNSLKNSTRTTKPDQRFASSNDERAFGRSIPRPLQKLYIAEHIPPGLFEDIADSTNYRTNQHRPRYWFSPVSFGPGCPCSFHRSSRLSEGPTPYDGPPCMAQTWRGSVSTCPISPRSATRS
jgi:hypothetical protein